MVRLAPPWSRGEFLLMNQLPWLVGPVRFTKFPAPVRKAMAGRGPELYLAAQGAEVVVRALAGRDAVLARGVLRKIPAVDVTSGYRRASATWALAIDAGHEGHGVAWRGAGPLAGPLARAALRGAAAGIAAFVVVFVAAASLAQPLGARSFGLVTPLGRERVLRDMSEEPRASHHHDPERRE
jgi:hypothetical protein